MVDKIAGQPAGAAEKSLDLATAPPVRLGPINVSPAALEVAWPGGVERIAPKVMLTLVALAHAKGATVSRAALVEQCWDARIVGDDAVNRVIAELRRLALRTGGHFHIETIPRVGFRLVETFAGDAADKSKKSKPPPNAIAARGLRNLTARRIVTGAAAVAVVSLGASLFFKWMDQEKSASGFRSPVTNSVTNNDAAPDVATLRPFDPPARRALDELGRSPVPADRNVAALARTGDIEQALDVLEALAQDLEQAGNARAASQSYTRLAALALLSDQGRGLSARRKAFALDPTSAPNMQGLLFDTMLLKGPKAAITLADELLGDPSVGNLARGFALAIRAVAHIDGGASDAESRRAIDALVAFGEESQEASVAQLALWPSALFAWRSDRLSDARLALESAGAEMQFAIDVVRVRILFSAGDLHGALAQSVSLLEARRARGLFLPWPMFETACLAGLFAGQERTSVQYCDMIAGQQNESPATPRIFAALAAAGRLDHAQASRDLEAAAAMIDDADVSNLARFHLAELYVAGRRGDLIAAVRAAEAHRDLVEADQWLRKQRASRIATAARLLAEFGATSGDRALTCREAQTAEQLYASLDAGAGVLEAQRELQTSDCR